MKGKVSMNVPSYYHVCRYNASGIVEGLTPGPSEALGVVDDTEQAIVRRHAKGLAADALRRSQQRLEDAAEAWREQVTGASQVKRCRTLCRQCSKTQPEGLWLHHPHPEHRVVTDVHIILAHESELAVVADAKDREARRHLAHIGPLPY